MLSCSKTERDNSLISVYQPAKAVHLVAAGVDITVIRSWLGHVSLDTTNHYARPI
jgi:site-specific recombinase XerD